MADFLITELDDRLEAGVPMIPESNTIVCLNQSVCCDENTDICTNQVDCGCHGCPL
jgi:hypothetical protein